MMSTKIVGFSTSGIFMDSHNIVNLIEGGYPLNPRPGDICYRYDRWSLYPFVMLECNNNGNWCHVGTQPGFVVESPLELGLRKWKENEQQRNR